MNMLDHAPTWFGACKEWFPIQLNGNKVESEQRMTSKENVRVKLSSRAVMKKKG